MAVRDRGFNADRLVIGRDILVVLKLEPSELHEVARPRPAGTRRVLLGPGEPPRAASHGSGAPLSPAQQDAVTALLARTTAQLQAVERELAEERVKLEYTEDEILEMERKEELAEAVSERYLKRPVGEARTP